MKHSIMVWVYVCLAAFTLAGKTLAYDVGAAVAFSEDPEDVWFNSVSQFVEIISSEPTWVQHFLNDYPNVGPYMWTEEEKGNDNFYADYTELSLVLGHGVVVVYPDGTKKSAIGFADRGYALPDDIRLGYASPDGFGYSVWTFIIQCSVLGDEYVDDWLQTLQGVHMVLGFASTATISNADFPELAYRLTGTGGYTREKVESAFFSTFLKSDGVHDDNRARIIAENSEVLDNDYLNSFERVPVDGSKIIVTGWVG
ncbi:MULTISPECIES: DUF6345 domain-containing protein [Archaeoglobus]|jgi:hypothetical protein|nr:MULTISPECIES: DUF6345 domain-containing protein [Archaeoglobus]AIG98575.1 hypothetical protein AFULGI_00018200 [Archaeoglobus fulgidus DSM 8774]KUJ92810.1 MAG: hypothetical protein XD40_2004 [Archaeoglobus fulgidus]KUK05522.1 MAG: Uncharacterized protein XD48_2240 [Archaeoglobus fulgidus]MDI3498803.1 hypothetical protein [Archaeoglobus sp.]